MKVLVAYIPNGNTRKVAEAIVEEIREEKEIKKMEDLRVSRIMIFFSGFPIIRWARTKDGEAHS